MFIFNFFMPAIKKTPSGESLSDFVYKDIRSLIRRQVLRPGDRVRENEIAERLTVSRSPVREALKQLEADGLIEPAPPRGFVVVALTQRRVSELYAMREFLAGVAAKMAAEQAGPMEIDNLEQLLRRFRKASTPTEAAELNRRLSLAIVSAAHNEYLSRALRALDDAVELLGDSTYTSPGRISDAIEENEGIVKAIAGGEASMAEEAAKLHVRNSAKIRSLMLFGTDT